jgi:hypothetical protein
MGPRSTLTIRSMNKTFRNISAEDMAREIYTKLLDLGVPEMQQKSRGGEETTDAYPLIGIGATNILPFMVDYLIEEIDVFGSESTKLLRNLYWAHVKMQFQALINAIPEHRWQMPSKEDQAIEFKKITDANKKDQGLDGEFVESFLNKV